MYPIDFVRRAAERFPDRIAASDGARALTFRELIAKCDAAASAFQAIAGTARPRIAVCSPNTLEHFIAIMAVHASGGVLVPLNYRNAKAEIADLIDYVRPQVVFADASVADKIPEGARGLVLANLAEPSRGDSFEALIAAHAGRTPQWPDVTLADASAIKFTGGSSGKPKGVEQSFRCISTLVANMLVTFRFDEGDRHLCVAPISHGAGTFMLPVLAAGGSNILSKTVKADAVLAELEAQAITTMFAPPTLIYALMDAAAGRAPELPALRRMIYGAAPMPPERVREARDFFGGRLAAVYGQTEMPALMTALRPEDLADDQNLASAGRPVPFLRLAIMDPDGRILPPGEMGEIVAQGDMMMSGYLDMPDKTAETIVDGWLHTGDVGLLDQRGFLFIKDRLRDVVITGGFNVYPSDVEAALGRHPAVYDSVAFGVPDAKWGERLEAAVQLHPGQSVDPAELIEFAKGMIGSIKAPKAIHLFAELPRSPVGKVQRREAKEAAMQRAASEAA